MEQNMIYDVSYMEALKRGFKQYATFSGRASRSEFWRFMVSREIIINSIGVLSIIVDMIFGETSDISDYTIWLFIIMHLIYLMPTIAYSCRRLHDIGRSGMTLFMVLIPIVGFFVLLSDFVKQGDVSSNAYGERTSYVVVTPTEEEKIGIERTASLREDVTMGALAIILYIWVFVYDFIPAAWIAYNTSGLQ